MSILALGALGYLLYLYLTTPREEEPLLPPESERSDGASAMEEARAAHEARLKQVTFPGLASPQPRSALGAGSRGPELVHA